MKEVEEDAKKAEAKLKHEETRKNTTIVVEPNKTTLKPKKSSKKDLPPVSKSSSVLKNDQSKKKEGKQRKKTTKCPETLVEKNILNKRTDVNRKIYLKSLLNQSLKQVEEEAKEALKDVCYREEPSQATKKTKKSSKKDQLTITASNEGNDQRRKRKEGKGKGKRRKEGEKLNESKKTNESSEKDRPPISVGKKASVLKNDQVKVKKEKLGKKSKTSHEVPGKKCMILEEVGSKNIMNKTSDPSDARKRKQSSVSEGGGSEKKSKVKRDFNKEKNATSAEKSTDKSKIEKIIVTWKPFTPLEDEYLRQIIESGQNVSFTELGRRMNRHQTSVKERMEKIKHGEDLRILKKTFTLEEDLIIIDSLIQNLLNNKTLRTAMSTIYDFDDKSMALRPESQRTSVTKRWLCTLQPWLLSYYEKTLNLEIRPMLANYLRDNFESRQQIDWDQTVQVKSFSGQTVKSLKASFSIMIRNCRKRKNIKSSEVTLQDIVEYANSVYPDRKMRNPIKRRQQAVIGYFEESVKKHNIKNFLN